MKLKPINDRIVVKPLDSDTVTTSGIVIPDSAKEKPQQGKVLGVGSGKRVADGTLIPLTVKEGDTVLFTKFAGQTVKLDNVDHIVLKEDEILAIVE